MQAVSSYTWYNILIYFSVFIVLILLNRFIITKDFQNRRLFFCFNVFTYLFILWLIGGTFDNLSASPLMKMIWTDVKYAGITGIGPMCVVMALAYTRIGQKRSDKWISPGFAASIFVIPVLCYIGLLTDFKTHLFYDLSGVHYGKGIIFWILVCYEFICGSASYLYIAGWLIESRSRNRYVMVIFLTLIFAFPLAGTLLEDFQIIPKGMEIIPVFFCVSILAFAYGVKRYGVLEWTPISVSEIFENLPVGIIIIDREGETIAVNPAARTLLRPDPERNNLFAIIDKLSDGIDAARNSGRTSFTITCMGRDLICDLLPIPRPAYEAQGFALSIMDASWENMLFEKNISVLFETATELDRMSSLIAAIFIKIESASVFKEVKYDNLLSDLGKNALELKKMSDRLRILSVRDRSNEIIKTIAIKAAPIIHAYANYAKEIYGGGTTQVELKAQESLLLESDPELFAIIIETIIETITIGGKTTPSSLNVYLSEDGFVMDAITDVECDTNEDDTQQEFRAPALMAIYDPHILICRLSASLLGGNLKLNPLGENRYRIIVTLPEKTTGLLRLTH
jgi:PAS domain-containing protein